MHHSRAKMNHTGSIMTRRTSPPKQLLTLRQTAIFIGIVALAVFAFMYGRNALRYRELQKELVKMEVNIAAVEREKEDIDREFDESISPAVVEDFVRKALNWVRPGDEVIVMVGPDAAAPSREESPSEPKDTAENGADDENPKANWQLWLELLTGENSAEE